MVLQHIGQQGHTANELSTDHSQFPNQPKGIKQVLSEWALLIQIEDAVQEAQL
jgi:hypothetical protein